MDAVFNGAQAISNSQGEIPKPNNNNCGDNDKSWNANCGLKQLENKKPSKPVQGAVNEIKELPPSGLTSEIPEPPAGCIRVFDQGHNRGQVLSYQDFIAGKGLAGGIRPEFRKQYFKDVVNGSAERVFLIPPNEIRN